MTNNSGVFLRKFVAVLVGRTQDGGISGYCMEAQETKAGAGIPTDPDSWDTVVRSYSADQLKDLETVICIDDAQMEVHEVFGSEEDPRDNDISYDQHYSAEDFDVDHPTGKRLSAILPDITVVR